MQAYQSKTQNVQNRSSLAFDAEGLPSVMTFFLYILSFFTEYIFMFYYIIIIHSMCQ